MEITKQTIEIFKERLDAYVIIEEPFSKGFSAETHLLDMLYFMGLAIDEKKFYAAQGFDEFKKIINKAINEK